MWKPSTNRSRPSLTLDDGLMIWRARERYHVKRFLSSLALTIFLLEGLGFLLMGRWDLALFVCGLQWGIWCSGRWLMRWGWRSLRTWWQGVVVVLVLSLGLSGCETMERGVARMHGITVDPLPGPCAPESYQAKQCLAVQKEKGKP